jgi:phosphoenolpyruvate carboxylase
MYQEWPFFRTFLSNVQVLTSYPLAIRSEVYIAEGSWTNLDPILST